MPETNPQALLIEYEQVNSNFRVLTDIRFKLLALLPIAAAVAILLRDDYNVVVGWVFSCFGLLVTAGIATYNERNDQLYDELIGRAATIERSLGLPDGSFNHRPRPWLEYKILGVSWKVNHGSGIGLIYVSTIALWLSLCACPSSKLSCLRTRVMIKTKRSRIHWPSRL